MISDKQKQALFLDLHRAIEESAINVVEQIRSTKDVSLPYPPNGGLSDNELAEINQLNLNPAAESALKKIVADAASYPVFRLLSLIDGVSDPHELQEFWTGLRLSSISNGDEEFESMLHDDFFDSYWEWRKKRPDQSWKLDNL